MPKLTRTSKRENVTPTPTGSGAGAAVRGATFQPAVLLPPEMWCPQLVAVSGERGIKIARRHTGERIAVKEWPGVFEPCGCEAVMVRDDFVSKFTTLYPDREAGPRLSEVSGWYRLTLPP